MEKTKQFLEKNKIEFILNFDVSLISSIKIGSILRLAVFPKSQKEFEKILVYFTSTRTYFKVIGNASNVLFLEDVSYPVIVTNKMRDEIKIENNIVEVSAGVALSKFCEVLKKNKLSGFEGLIGIPATVGGAIVCNAGAFGYSISDRLVKVKVFKNGRSFDNGKKN